jgi:predicted ester cyclase
MQVSDDAFIARDFAHFNHHPNATMYYPGGVVMNLTQHIEDLRLYFSTYSDAAPHNHNYRVIFGEGDWTVALAHSAGVNDGPVSDLSGNWVPPTMRALKFDLMTIARWDGGWMMEEYLWVDGPLMYRQLGVLPVPPADFLPDIELNPYTAPLSTEPAVNNATSNKAKMVESDDALNTGNFSAEALHLSQDVKIYGLTDQPLDLSGYLMTLKSLKKSFPDLHLENKPYRQIIAQGDWTATVAMLSGTFEGSLELPPYLGVSPAEPNGSKFNLLHYTICRWQNGKILEMRINADVFGIVGSLGIPLE